MTTFRRWVSGALLLLLLLLVALWGTQEIRQQLLRARAERLLADIQSLNVSQSNWADAQRLVTRWGRWSDGTEPCTSGECEYDIVLQDAIPFEYGSEMDESSHPFARLVDRLGLRSSAILAAFDVRHGVVTRKRFTVFVPRPVRFWSDHVGSQLVAGAMEGPNFFGVNLDLYSGNIYSHVGEGAHGNLFAESTPLEPLQHRQELMAFRLNCIDQWFPCTEKAQLAPQAAAEYAIGRARDDAESNAVRDPESVSDCSVHELEFLARQSRNVWVVTAEAKPELVSDSSGKTDPEYRVFVQPQQMLKRKHVVSSQAELPTNEALKQQPTFVKDKSAKFFIFGDVEDYLSPPKPFFQLSACPFTPATQENLAAVNRGIAEDFDP
jgi:hypothetical protein